MTRKETVCWDCMEPFTEMFTAANSLLSFTDSLTFYLCQNEMCPRYGVASAVFKIKEVEI